MSEYGTVGSIDDAFDVAELESKGIQVDADIDGSLWDYHERGLINGIQVVEADRGLAIDSQEDLGRMFVLKASSQVMLLKLSMDDPTGIKQYNDLLKRQENGDLVIREEQKQFDATNGHFIVLLRIDHLRYELHPRFEYKRQEVK